MATPVHPALQYSILLGMLVLALLALLDPRTVPEAIGESPWRLTKAWLFDPLVPGVSALSLEEYRSYVLWQCLLLPAVLVHAADALLGAYLAVRRGILLWPQWFVWILLLGSPQLLPLLTSSGRLKALVGAWTVALFAVAPYAHRLQLAFF